MNIGVIGCGNLGLGFSLLCENNGFKVLVSDSNKDYVFNLNQKVCLTEEPLIQRMLFESKKFSATTDNLEVIKNSDVIFTFVDTPPNIDGDYDTTKIFAIANEFLRASNMDISIYDKKFIIGSSTNPGDCEKIQRMLEVYTVQVAYCPFFVSKGDIIRGIQSSNNILIGSKYTDISDVIISIFRNIKMPKITSHTMSLTASEITKIAINSFLATKISFANMIGEILIKSGLSNEIDIVLSAIGGNNFIGKEYLKYGFGYGGPYLPRDSRFLSGIVSQFDDNNLLDSVDKSNKKHAEFLKQYFISKNPNKSIPFIIEFLSYKKGTNNLEESQRYQLCIDLLDEGYYVYVIDDNLLSSKLHYISEKYNNRLKFYKKIDSLEGYKINL